jgi:hypothetical protein
MIGNICPIEKSDYTAIEKSKGIGRAFFNNNYLSHRVVYSWRAASRRRALGLCFGNKRFFESAKTKSAHLAQSIQSEKNHMDGRHAGATGGFAIERPQATCVC